MFINRLITRRASWKDEKVRIPQRYGIRMMDRRKWDRVRPALINGGVVQCDGIYSYKKPGQERAMAYWLTPEYANRRVVQVQLSDQRLIANLAEIEARSRAYWLPIHVHLADMLNLITIDREAALRKANRIRNPKKRIFAINAIERIAAGDIRLRVSLNTGRVFSSLTWLPRGFRQFLRLAGLPLCGFDICAAQPYLQGLHAAGLPIQSAPKHAPAKRRNAEQAGGRRGSNTEEYQIRGAPMHAKLAWDGIPDDVLRHLHACEDGSYYTDFACAIRAPDRDPLPKHRAKKAWLTFTFARHRPEGAWWNRFSAAYPNVASFQADIKTRYSIAAVLQRSESNVIINGVCEQIRLAHPNIPIVSIHDCVMTTPEHEQTILDINNEIWARFNAHPRTKPVL
jgi:hypothetical protein